MTLCECRGIDGKPVEMFQLYVKNHKSRMNQTQEDYTPIGYICPLCKKTVVSLK